MVVQSSKYLGRDGVLIWWPATRSDVAPHLDRVPVVMLWQCPESLAQELRRWAFRCQPFTTLLIDLARTEEQLWQQLNQLCRRQIRKTQALNCVISCNDDTDAARSLINNSIRRLGYRGELGGDQWRGILTDHDVFLCRWQGTPVVAHALLRDPPQRARLQFSGSEDRADARFHDIVGPCNRLLHWHELQHYKAKGFRFYDFGGIRLNSGSTVDSITQFKLSFGGDVVEEPRLYLSKNPTLRILFRSIGLARGAVRKVPWPEAWLRAARKRSNLMSWLR